MSQVQFDESDSRSSGAKASEGTVLQALLRAAGEAGLDPVAELYNEALALAKDGHYGDARERLQVLLGLAPADGDARLLLAKVYVAGQQWRRAIAALDDASECGAHVPETLRDAVVRHLHADVDQDEARATRAVRENGEISKLRTETRRLRSENAHLAGHNRALQREAARWGMVATVTSVLAILLIIAQWWMAAASGGVAEAVADGAAPVEATDEAAAAPAPAGSAIAPTADDDVVVRNPGLSDTITRALADADLGTVSVTVRGSTASLSGSVPSHTALKRALATVEGLPGVEKVTADAVVNLARRDGTTYEVRPGDSLSAIALKLYGNDALYPVLLAANGGKTDLQVGQMLQIPAIRE